jgi:hypothetical protein
MSANSLFGYVLGSVVLLCQVLPADAETRMWINTDDSKRRTCPSVECGIVGRFYFRESVVVYETMDGWSRVSRYYSAGCQEGRSAFVDFGRDDCSKSNGIKAGEFAEWVKSDFLTSQRPDDPT